jgi:hypothetical protein
MDGWIWTLDDSSCDRRLCHTNTPLRLSDTAVQYVVVGRDGPAGLGDGVAYQADRHNEARLGAHPLHGESNFRFRRIQSCVHGVSVMLANPIVSEVRC